MTKNISRSTVQDICRLLGYDPKDVAEIEISPHMIHVTTLHHSWDNTVISKMPTVIKRLNTHMVRGE